MSMNMCTCAWVACRAGLAFDDADIFAMTVYDSFWRFEQMRHDPDHPNAWRAFPAADKSPDNVVVPDFDAAFAGVGVGRGAKLGVGPDTLPPELPKHRYALFSCPFGCALDFPCHRFPYSV